MTRILIDTPIRYLYPSCTVQAVTREYWSSGASLTGVGTSPYKTETEGAFLLNVTVYSNMTQYGLPG